MSTDRKCWNGKLLENNEINIQHTTLLVMVHIPLHRLIETCAVIKLQLNWKLQYVTSISLLYFSYLNYNFGQTKIVATKFTPYDKIISPPLPVTWDHNTNLMVLMLVYGLSLWQFWNWNFVPHHLVPPNIEWWKKEVTSILAHKGAFHNLSN